MYNILLRVKCYTCSVQIPRLCADGDRGWRGIQRRNASKTTGLSRGGSGRDAWWFWPRATVRHYMYSGWYSARLYYIMLRVYLWFYTSSSRRRKSILHAIVHTLYRHIIVMHRCSALYTNNYNNNNNNTRHSLTTEMHRRVHTIVVFPGEKHTLPMTPHPQAQNCRYIYMRVVCRALLNYNLIKCCRVQIMIIIVCVVLR